MNSDQHRDDLVDMLLWELVGKEIPPDIRARVLEAVEDEERVATDLREPAPKAAPAPRLRPLNAPVRPVAAATRRKPAPRLTPVQRPKASKLPLLAAAAVVALLVGFGSFAFLQQISGARTPVLTEVSGTADRSAGPIPLGQSLSTGSRSSAVITYEDGTVVELSPGTTIVVTNRSPWDQSKGIEVVAGGVDADVAPQPDGSPMVLTSKDASAEIVGTKLSFQIDDNRTRLEVTEGAVRFVSRTGVKDVLVKSGLFAEAGASGFRTGAISVPLVRGITGFTLMNAETDRPLRDETLADGETISLASLPTREINLRADFEGDPPAIVRLNLTREDGDATGLPSHASDDQKYPPFFVAGDYWAEGRPNDCRAWTPRPGLYHLSAQAIYTEDGSQPLNINFRITE